MIRGTERNETARTFRQGAEADEDAGRKAGGAAMLREVLTVSALILAVLLVRAVFKNRVPKRMVYCLWLVVLVKLCLPGTVVSLPVLPAAEAAAPVQRVELPMQTAPVVPQPAQAVVQPQVSVQQPVSPAQEAAEPSAKPLTAMQIFQIIWVSGSALLGLWLLSTWLVFTVRLRKNRRFLGKHGRTRVYVSSAVKSPCLAGLVPAVYLTEDVVQTDSTELILRHELTHLRHLDHLWSFCRTTAVIVYWWNPFIWLAAICSKRDAELACDETVAAGLSDAQRLAYARAILAQTPRKAVALSLVGPPVKERILFLTKKQRTSVLCVILALLLVISAAGCSLTELTRQKSETVTTPEDAPVTGESADTPITQDEPLPVNGGSYDVTQPLQDWELARMDGVQTGMTQAQVEAITGPLTENEYGVLVDSQNISYRFWTRSGGKPTLMEMTWSANVVNDELVYITSQDAPAFRGICLGDSIDDVLAKFPCMDRELKYQQTQYVYGQEGDENYAVLHLIADSYYSLSFGIAGQWRASIDFSRVQQRVFNIVIYAEAYWQEANQEGEEMAARPQAMTLTVSSGKTYTLSAEDTAALEEIFSNDSMTPLASDPESVCVYQFSLRNHSYLLDETLGLAEMIVWMDSEHYDYYQMRLSNAESEVLRTVIDRYTQGTEDRTLQDRLFYASVCTCLMEDSARWHLLKLGTETDTPGDVFSGAMDAFGRALSVYPGDTFMDDAFWLIDTEYQGLELQFWNYNSSAHPGRLSCTAAFYWEPGMTDADLLGEDLLLSTLNWASCTKAASEEERTRIQEQYERLLPDFSSGTGWRVSLAPDGALALTALDPEQGASIYYAHDVIHEQMIFRSEDLPAGTN